MSDTRSPSPSTPKCCRKRCRRVARQAFDVRNSWGSERYRRHYEVCDDHAAPFLGGFLRADISEAIKRDYREVEA